jgi:hypothetical protein
MKRVLASAAVGAALLAAASFEASAWVCLAAGAGSSGYGRDPYYVQDAKIIALRTCERRSPIPDLHDYVVPAGTAVGERLASVS